MSYADVDLYEVEAYMRQMKYLAPGYVALWDPKPYNKKEAEIGDVGYIYKGTFRRLFNAVSGRRDGKNSEGVPEGFEPLSFDPEEDVEVKAQSEIISPGIPCCSNRVKVEAMESTHENLTFKFTKTVNDSMYVLVAPARAEERVLRSHKWDEWKAYFMENYKSWLRFGEFQLGRPMKLEELIFVRGWVKTSKWIIAALHDRGEYNLHLDMSVNLNASLEFTGQNSVNGYDLRHGADPPEAMLKAFREQRRLMGIPPTDRLSDPHTRCLFVQGFRMESQFLSGKKIVAAAEPKDPDVSRGNGGGTAVCATWSSHADGSDYSLHAAFPNNQLEPCDVRQSTNPASKGIFTGIVL